MMITASEIMAMFVRLGKDPSLHTDGTWEDPEKRIQRIVDEINSGKRTVSDVRWAITRLPNDPPSDFGQPG